LGGYFAPLLFYTFTTQFYYYYMKVKINVPTSLSDISLDQYQRFLKFDMDDETPNSEVLKNIIEIFCGIDFEDVATFKYADMNQIANDIQEIFHEEQSVIPTFKLLGQEYGLIPNFDEMSLGEYIDLDQYFHDWETMDKAMTILYRPIKYKKGHKYLIEEYEGCEQSEVMKNAPLDVVLGIKVFFYNIGIELLNHIPNYLQEESGEITDQQRQILEQSGVGIRAFTDYLKGTLPGSMT